MAEFRIDDDGVGGVASTLLSDPRTLHALARELTRAVLSAEAEVGSDCASLRPALARLRGLGAGGLEVVAEATGALAGDLYTATADARVLEQSVATAYRARVVGRGALE